MNTYGILDSQNCHIDVSRTEKGAKNYATRNGYKTVSIRYSCGYDVDIVATKRPSGKWAKHGSIVRETVYKVMVCDTSEIFRSTDLLAAERYLFLSLGKYGIDYLSIKKGWIALEY